MSVLRALCVVIGNSALFCFMLAAAIRSFAGPLDTWQWRNPLPTGNTLSGITYGNGVFMAVGHAGAIVTSADGANWISRGSANTNALRSVAFGNGTFVAVGTNGVIVSSPDGASWTARNSGTFAYLRGATYSNGTFVVVGYGGVILTSPDAATWTARTSGTTANLFGVSYVNGYFEAAGDLGTILSSTNGVAWTSRNSGSSSTLYDVAYGAGTFVVVGKTGAILTSPDQLTWAAQFSGTSSSLEAVTYANGIFIASGASGTILTSADGVTWSSQSSGTVNAIRDIVYGNGTFAAAGVFGTIVTSSDGVIWTSRNSGYTDHLRAITYGNGTYVAVGTNGTVLSSTDGLAWFKRTSNTAGFLHTVFFANALFVTAGGGGNIQTSPDGVTWSSQVSGVANVLRGIAYGGNKFVVVGDAGVVLTSPDAVTWTLRASGTANSLNGVTYANGSFHAVGNLGTILSSVDGTTWTPRSGSTVEIDGISFGNGTFVIVGTNGTVLTSADGTNWTSRTSGTSALLRSVAFGNGTFVAAGFVGTILISPDGVAWTNRNSGTENFLYGVTFASNTFLAVGTGGAILQSGVLNSPSVSPGITTQPQSQTVVAGSNATFSVAATGSAPLSYQWRFNVTNILAATSSTHTVTNAQQASAGNYSVVITNSFGSATSSNALLTVCSVVAATGPSNLTNCPGVTATFSTVASGSGPFTYQWIKDGAIIGGATASSYTIPSVTSADAGTYCVVVSGACNSVTNCATLTVKAATSASGPSNLTNCPGTSATFSTVASGSGPFTYQWTKNGAVIGGATASAYIIPSVTSAEAGTYCVIVNGTCNSVTNCVTLTVSTATSASGPSNLTNCHGSGATFSTVASGSGPFTYQWSKNGATIGGATASSYTIPSVASADAGTYCVMVSGACNSVTNCATLTVSSPTTASALTALTNCPGTSATFSTVASGRGPLTYQWTKNAAVVGGATASSYTIASGTGADAGTYCVVVDGACTSVTNCATLTVLVPPSITQQPISLTVTQGNNAVFSISASGDGPLNYQWRLSGADISGVTGSSYTVISAQSTNGGNYDVVVSNTCGSVTSSVASLTVRIPPGITQQPMSLTITQGAAATFSVIATGDAPLRYQWRFGTPGLGGGNLPNATSSTLSLTNGQSTNAGNYRVIVSNLYGSVTSAIATLTVRVPPSIVAQPVSLVVTQGQNATFSVSAGGDPPLSYQWRFSGSDLSGAIANSYTVTNAQSGSAGNYEVFVSNSFGSVTTALATLTVYGELRLDYELLSTSGSLGWRIFVPSRQPYSLETSSNLMNWLPVFTNQSGATGNDFIEPRVTNSGRQFFRGRRWP